MKPLDGLRILICGKGGSGKSTLTALLSRGLELSGYNVILFDGDASNPGGLGRLVIGHNNYPAPLLEFFGGREHVICPSDDPSPLTRLNDLDPVTHNHLDISEFPEKYYIKNGNRFLFRAGKTAYANEGCDGPMSKITRDFIIDGKYVTLLDTEAGIEHFGRGVEKNVNIILIVVNSTYESIKIAGLITNFCKDFQIEKVGAIINNSQSKKDEQYISDELENREVKILGTIRHDRKIHLSGLKGTAINETGSKKDLLKVIRKMETEFG